MGEAKKQWASSSAEPVLPSRALGALRNKFMQIKSCPQYYFQIKCET
jgi:hypothetical protein